MAPSPLITTEDLAARLGAPDLRVLDASWHLDGHDAWADFEAGRIPGAAFFDLEALSDHGSPLPHMLPTAEAFAAGVGELGVSETDDIVVYDAVGLFSAARAWWMFRVMGARRVRVLDGGLPKWRAEGRPMHSGPAPAPAPAVFSPRLMEGAVAGLDDVRAALAAEEQVIDARAAGRFSGAVPEPRAGLRAGHMPGARNLPFAALLNADGTFRRGQALRDAFADAGVDPARPAVTTCGSGVTAAILSLGLAELGAEPGTGSRLYDGSWAEWGGRPDTPVVTG